MARHRQTPEGKFDARLWAIAAEAERDTLKAFRGVAPEDVIKVWPELSPQVRAAILKAQGDSLTAVAQYLDALVDGFVPVDAAPWLGRIGDKPLDDWLEVTPRAHAGRLARGVSLEEAAVSTARFLAAKAADESHRIGRGAVARTTLSDSRFLGWKRVAEPGACDFCRMLASRGAVYSKETVATTRTGLAYHNHCRCRPVALPAGTGTEEWNGRTGLEYRDRRNRAVRGM